MPFPGCDYFQEKHQNMEVHIKNHENLWTNMQSLGWFWGSVRTMLQANPGITIRDAFGEGPMFQCNHPDCGKLFATEINLNRYYSHDHAGEKRNRSVVPYLRLFQTLGYGGGHEARIPEEESVYEASQRPPRDEEAMQPRHDGERGPMNYPELVQELNPLQPGPDRLELESEHQTQYQEQRRREFRQKLEMHDDKTLMRVNMPQLSQSEMRKVKKGLMDLFKTVINPTMKELKPRTSKWKDWLAFKGAYEEALHLILLHVTKALKRKEKGLYDFRRINPKMQKARAEYSEERFAKQDIQRRLMSVKTKLEKLPEYQEDNPITRRKQMKLTQELGQFFRLISREAREEIFGEDNDEQVWEILNISEEHRTRVIEWLDARITEEIAKEFEDMAGKYREWKVQDTYRKSKSTAMKRFINKKESPPCPI
jgi:hypothetical protein